MSVVEADLEFGDDGELVAVQGASAVPSEPAAIPTVTDADAENGGLVEKIRDVVGAVPEALVVAGPSGAEHVVIDGVTVEGCLEDAEGRDAQGGSRDRTVIFVEGELAAEQGSGVEFGRRRDHAGDPFDDRWIGGGC